MEVINNYKPAHGVKIIISYSLHILHIILGWNVLVLLSEITHRNGLLMNLENLLMQVFANLIIHLLKSTHSNSLVFIFIAKPHSP
jgi:hypothetical protein